MARNANQLDVDRAREYIEARGGSTERLSAVRILEIAGMRPVDALQFDTLQCPGCGQSVKLSLSRAGVADWYAGALIQVAFPELTADQREQMITGYDAACWARLMGPEE